MSNDKANVVRRLSHTVLTLFITLIFVGLVLTVVALPPDAAGLSDDVNAELARTGIRSSVTATLLDFRGYDTLLEIAVLLLAATAIRTLSRGDLPTKRPDDEILVLYSRILVPFMILVAGYLLMAGLDASGGAFQAGAILAAAGVLLILTGRRVPLPDEGLSIRLGLAIGLATFLAVGVAGMLVADAFLDYPPRNTAYIMLLLEVSVSVSVALSLLEMFVGVLRGGAIRSVKNVTKQVER